MVNVTEAEARAAIVRWARGHFAPHFDDEPPDVALLGIVRWERDGIWQAHLEVQAAQSMPGESALSVSFWFDDHLEEHRIHIQSVHETEKREVTSTDGNDLFLAPDPDLP